MRHVTCCAAVAACGLSAPVVLAGSSGLFTGLGDLPGGIFASRATAISPDGRAVVGYSTTASPSGNGGFLWMAETGLQQIPGLTPGSTSTVAHAVANRGRVVVGISNSRGYRWTPDGGTVDLGSLKADNSGFVNAHGLSANGRIVMGTSQTDDFQDQFDGFLWKPGSGMSEIDFFDGVDLSNDGRVAVGLEVVGGGNFEPALWTRESGVVRLGHMDGGTTTSPNRISGDGQVVVGQGDYLPSRGFAETGAFRWSAETGMQLLPNLAGVSTAHTALGVNVDGSMVVGATGAGGNSRAFIWDEINGTRDINVCAAEDWGIDLGGWRLTSAVDISDNGRAITGIGINPLGRTEAWYIRVPSPGGVAAFASAWALAHRRRRRHG